MISVQPPPDVQTLLKEAQEETGLCDLGQGPGLEWLEKFVWELTLPTFQQVFMRPSTGRTKRRLKAAVKHRLLLDHYEPGFSPITWPPPVFILGLPRTGSTFMQELLSLQPGWRAPTVTEGRHPFARMLGTWDAAKAETSRFLRLMERTDWFKMHAMYPNGPEECRVLLEPSFTTFAWAYQYIAPRYSTALRVLDFRESWKVLARLLRVLDPSYEDRWLLKEVSHISHVDSLLKVFPTCRIVWLHRNPEECLPSLVSLATKLQTSTVGRAEVDLTARLMMGKSVTDLTLMHKVLQFHPHVMHVEYDDFVKDPISTCANVVEWVGDKFRSQKIKKWAREHPQYKYGRHVYTPEMFGLSVEEIRYTFAGLR